MIVKTFFNSIVKKGDAKRDAGLKEIDGVSEINNIYYMDDKHPLHTLNVYRPANVQGKLPVIINIHGGGWVYGDKELNRKYCMHLASHGFAVVGMSFRLVPEVKFAGSMCDIITSINYVQAHSDEYGLDMNNVFLSGDSAGGHSAAMLLASQSNTKLQQVFGATTTVKFNAVCFTCAAFNLGKVSKLPLTGMALLNGIYGFGYRTNKEKKQLVKLYDFDNVIPDNLCPSFLVSAYGDFLRKQSFKMKALMEQKGIVCDMQYYDKPLADGNKLVHVFNVIQPWWQASQDTNARTCDFFKKYIV